MQHYSKTLNLSPCSSLLSHCSLFFIVSIIVQARCKSDSALLSNFNELHSYPWMRVLNKLNVPPSFVKIYINSACFVVGGVSTLHGFMFMIKRFLLWWIETPWCFGGIRNDPFPGDGPFFNVLEFPLVLFFSLVRLLMNQTPPFLFGICDGPHPSVGPLLMLVFFLVLFILLMMNWNPLPFSCVHYGHLLSLGPLPSVFELPSRCCPFSWCNSQWIEIPPFFGVHNGLIPKAGPFPNIHELPVVMLLSSVQLLISKPIPLSLLFIMVVFIVILLFLVFLSFPWCYSFFWCGSWWIWTPLFGVCDGPLPNVNPFLMQVLS